MFDKIKILARRSGIEVIEVKLAYISVIGILKYAPQYSWSPYLKGRKQIPQPRVYKNAYTLDDQGSRGELG